MRLIRSEAISPNISEMARPWKIGSARITEAPMTTRYLPKRHEEMAGGSLYWIHEHALVGRSPLIGFAQAEDGRPGPRQAQAPQTSMREKPSCDRLAVGPRCP